MLNETLETINNIQKFEEYIVFDTETTGLNAKTDRIIELGAYKIKNGEIIDSLHLYINPHFAISDKISHLTGITNDFLKDKPFESEVFDRISMFFGKIPIGAYNTTFDKKMMEALYHRNGAVFNPLKTFDVLALAKGAGLKLSNFKLKTLAKHYKVDKDITFHSALDDAFATFLVLKKLEEHYLLTPVGTRIAKINSIQSWEGYRGMKRIYINTDAGTVYYDCKTGVWAGKDCEINELDTEVLIDEVLKRTKSASIKDLKKFNGRI